MSGYGLPRPSAVPTIRPVTRSNAGCLRTPANRHDRRTQPLICDASGQLTGDTAAQQDVRSRIAAAKQYRERVGPQAASSGGATESESQAAEATPAGSNAIEASTTEDSSFPAAGEGARLHEAVARYGDVWAEKLEGQYAAAREQLDAQPSNSQSSQGLANSEPPASELSLTDLVIERLNKRELAAPQSLTARGLPTASAGVSGAGNFMSDRGSSTQAAGFLAGLSARPPPAAPHERPGSTCRNSARGT